jgi:hypothetical protein
MAPNHDPLLTIRQLAEREGLAVHQVVYLIRACALPVYRVCGVKIRLSEYLAWLEQRRIARAGGEGSER